MAKKMILMFMGLLLSSALVISGCGGGGGGSTATTTPTDSGSTVPADFTGTWTGTYQGTALSYNITQSGDNISMVRTLPSPLSTSQGITYSGKISGNSAVVNTYFNGTYAASATWTKTNNTTITVVIDSCTPPQGFSCGAPGTSITVTKQLYSISGKVTINGFALAGVAISTVNASVTTDNSGNYFIGSVDKGNYTVTPVLSGYTFTPVSQAVPVSGANIVGINFTATATPVAAYTISGTIATATNAGIPGVSVSLVGKGSSSTFTDTRGVYSFSGITSGSYTLSPSLTGHSFAPTSKIISVSNADLTAQDFTGTPPITATITPITTVNGSISPATAQTVISGSTKQFTITPNSGYVIGSVSGCNGTLKDNSYTTGVISESCSITASFRAITTGDFITDPTTGMVLLKLSGGTFVMGDTFGDGFSWERPTHQVTVSDFYIGKYEVTQAEWQAVMGTNPSQFTTCGANCPVESVSWNDVQTFITTLNRKSGANYRLPTEAEWEYASRSGGQSQKYSGSNDVNAVAWYVTNSGSTTHPVGQLQANGLGLYDMSGNVWEWVSDWFGTFDSTAKTNPTGPSVGATHVQRGGAFNGGAIYVRATMRNESSLDPPSSMIGFRLAATRR